MACKTLPTALGAATSQRIVIASMRRAATPFSLAEARSGMLQCELYPLGGSSYKGDKYFGTVPGETRNSFPRSGETEGTRWPSSPKAAKSNSNIRAKKRNCLLALPQSHTLVGGFSNFSLFI